LRGSGISKHALAKAALEPVEWYDSPRQIVLRALGIAVGTVLVLFIGAIFVVPRAYGGQALTVMSGSMQPSLNPGDVIAVKGVEPKDACAEIGIGNIVTYFAESGASDLVTHRVIAKDSGTYPDGTHCRFATQGDANNAADPDLISPEQVRGKFMYGIPAVGWARDWVGRNRMLAAAALLLLAVAYYAWPGGGSSTRVLSTGFPMLAGGVAVAAGVPTAGDPGLVSTGGATRANSAAEIELRIRELALRERELRLREAEAAAEFGYVPPQSEALVPI
jgi:signal peptidase I